MSEGAAGLDLFASFESSTEVVLQPRARALVGSGVAIELERGFEAQVRPRSGLALKHGVTVLNSPGTVDADYRGEIKVLLVNLGEEPFTVRQGERIAQLVVARVERVRLEEGALRTTARGAGGYRSTGATPGAGLKKPGARRRGRGAAGARAGALGARARAPARARARGSARRDGDRAARRGQAHQRRHRAGAAAQALPRGDARERGVGAPGPGDPRRDAAGRA